ncbi:hypothetical protein Tco_0076155, partial [Tanacetum coccineum]
TTHNVMIESVSLAVCRVNVVVVVVVVVKKCRDSFDQIVVVFGIVRTLFDYIDFGSLAVRTAVVEIIASGLHIVVGKKALGFETNGQDIEK